MKEENKQAVKDLVNKYPSGPRGLLKKQNYEGREFFSEVYERYITRQNLRDSDEPSFYGYSDEALWRLGDGNNLNRYLCRDLVKEAFADEMLTGRQIRRRANRLHDKLKVAIDIISRNGTKGTWSIKWQRYSHDVIYVYASSKAEALSTASFLAGVFGKEVNDDVFVQFINIEDPQATNLRNSKKASDITERARNLVQAKEKELVIAKERLAEAESIASILITASSIAQETQI